MGKITHKLTNKCEIPKPKRRHRRKDLDYLHSRILRTKRKSDNVENICDEDKRSKTKPSKACKKYVRPEYTGIFRNGTKGKNIKKGKCENVVTKARLAGDALKLFDGESETICISESTTEDELPNKLSNKKLVKKNSEQILHLQEESPVLGKKQSQHSTRYPENVSEKNKETEVIFEPIDIPEVVINYNSGIKKMIKEKYMNEEVRKAQSSGHSTITSRNSDLHDRYTKLMQDTAARLSDEFKNVLNVESPLLAARKKLRNISASLEAKRAQHKTVRKLSNSISSALSVETSEYQACLQSSDLQSSAGVVSQFPENENNIRRSSEDNQHNKKNFSISNIDPASSKAVGVTSWRKQKCFDISSILQNNPNLPPKKRVSTITTSRKELPMQHYDKPIITIDNGDEPDNRHLYPNEIDRSKLSDEREFCEMNIVDMFQNLPTPSTVKREIDRYQSKVQESRTESMKMKDSERLEKPSTDLYTDNSNRENEVVGIRNNARKKVSLEVLSEAAAFVEYQHVPQTRIGNPCSRYIPIYPSRSNSYNQLPSSSYSSHGAGPSISNVEPQRHCTSSSVPSSEERHIYLNCSNCSQKYNISQEHQNRTETAQITMAPGYSYFPAHNCNVADNYVNLPNNMGHTYVLPLILNHDRYTYPQQVDDHHHMVCLQNFAQPTKYYALDDGENVRKIPLFVNDNICQRRHHGNRSAVFCSKKKCAHINLVRCDDTRNIVENGPL